MSGPSGEQFKIDKLSRKTLSSVSYGDSYVMYVRLVYEIQYK